MEAIWEGCKKWHSGLETMGKGEKYNKFQFIEFQNSQEKIFPCQRKHFYEVKIVIE